MAASPSPATVRKNWRLLAPAVDTVQRKLFLATDTDVATIPTVQMRRHPPRDFSGSLS